MKGLWNDVDVRRMESWKGKSDGEKKAEHTEVGDGDNGGDGWKGSITVTNSEVTRRKGMKIIVIGDSNDGEVCNAKTESRSEQGNDVKENIAGKVNEVEGAGLMSSEGAERSDDGQEVKKEWKWEVSFDRMTKRKCKSYRTDGIAQRKKVWTWRSGAKVALQGKQ